MGKVTEPSGDFMELLTDALRAGPGSPEWHQAVVELKKQGQEAADEYALLWRAREHLASGKDYREVKPGPGFARKVMEGIEKQPVKPAARPASMASAIAALAVVAVLAVVGVVGYWMYRSSGQQPAPREDLSGLVFVNTVQSGTFDDGIGPEWRTIGSLPLVAETGLRPGPAPKGMEYCGGGIVTATPLPADKPIALEVTFAGGDFGPDLVPEVFVSDRPEFSADRATSPHELVWLVQDGQAQVVLPGGRVEAAREAVKGTGEGLTVRIALGRETAMVESAGKRLWSGASGLAAGAPRYVGVRFLEKGGAKGSAVAVTSVRVKTPAEVR